MQNYNVFCLRSVEGLCCAVPESRAVPPFLGNDRWAFGGKLEAAGLLLRSPGTDDRRAVVVAITPTGTRLHTRLRRQRTRLFTDRLAAMPTDEAAALLGAIPALETLADLMRPAETMPSLRAGAAR